MGWKSILPLVFLWSSCVAVVPIAISPDAVLQYKSPTVERPLPELAVRPGKEQIAQKQLNQELLTNIRLAQPDQNMVQKLVREQLANETALRAKVSPRILPGREKAGVDTFTGDSAVDQHRAFTGGSFESINLGSSHRPSVVELETTFNLLNVSKTNADKLVRAGFGPLVRCNTFSLCKKGSKYRSADGSCNNLRNPTWGKSSTAMRRWLQPDYDDGVSKPRANNLPSARLVSRVVHVDSSPSDEHRRYTHMLMQWGQFLDHDFTKTPSQTPRPGYGSSTSCCGRSLRFRPECFPIKIPSGDPHFRTKCMEFIRSVQVANSDCKPAPVEQLNELTAYVDASQVYGSSQSQQRSLRSLRDGLLKQEGEFLPRGGACNTPRAPNHCFKAGDGRVNENPTLQSLHTIFVREHNRIARKLKALNGNSWNDEKLFQETRKIVGALMQKISYDEYLPIVLGSSAMTRYNLKVSNGPGYTSQYNSNQDASIRNAFATAAFRMGHSMIRDMLSSISKQYTSVTTDKLSDVFGDTNFILNDPVHSLGHFTRGLVHDCVQKVDKKLSSEVTNNLFKDNRGRSLDLAALNIQRGRDHGLPGYIYWRKFCQGGSLPTTFSQLSSTHSAAAISKLGQVYSNVKDIDLFPGALSENPTGGSLLGPTFTCLLGKQFQALKEGDRFWFEDNNVYVSFTSDQVKELRKASLSRIICDNTDTFKIQRNAFVKDYSKISCYSLPSVDLTKWQTCRWSSWSTWGSCISGWQTRTRRRLSGTCSGQTSSRRKCSTVCRWSSWSAWGACILGWQTRTRRRLSGSCTGLTSTRRRCSSPYCPPSCYKHGPASIRFAQIEPLIERQSFEQRLCPWRCMIKIPYLQEVGPIREPFPPIPDIRLERLQQK